MPVTIEPLDGVTFSKNRGVYLLYGHSARIANAANILNDSMANNAKWAMRIYKEFEYWISELKRKYAHGFEKTQHKGLFSNLFQFSHESHRVYGILEHPFADRPGYVAFIAVHYWGSKNQHEAPVTQLKQVAALSSEESYKCALRELRS